METRYLQQTSGGSYLVSLPKAWVRANGLGKGSQVGLTELDPNTLMVDSNPLGRPKPRSIEIEMGENVGRELTASYLSGYDRVLIRSEGTITAEQKEKMRIAASRLAGLEVINETADSLLLANLVVPVDLSVEDVMRRMHQIGSSMLADALSALATANISLAGNVVQRDDALDRLYFLSIRLLKMAVRDPRTAEKMGVLPAQCLDLRFAASMMEKIGDKSVEMCDVATSVEDQLDLPGALGNELTRLYQMATQALIHRDFRLSGSVTKERARISGLIASVGEHPPIMEEVRGMLGDVADHIFDIADVVTER